MIRHLLRWRERRCRVRLKERHFRAVAIDERMERRRRRLRKLGGSNVHYVRPNNQQPSGGGNADDRTTRTP